MSVVSYGRGSIGRCSAVTEPWEGAAHESDDVGRAALSSDRWLAVERLPSLCSVHARCCQAPVAAVLVAWSSYWHHQPCCCSWLSLSPVYVSRTAAAAILSEGSMVWLVSLQTQSAVGPCTGDVACATTTSAEVRLARWSVV